MPENKQNKFKDVKMMLRIFAFIKPFKFLLILQILLNTAFSFFSTFSVTLILPILELIFNTQQTKSSSVVASPMNSLTDNFFNFIFKLVQSADGTLATLFNIGVLILIVFGFKNLFKYLSAVTSTRLEEGVIKSIRDKIFSNLLGQSVDYFTASRQGNLISIITNDVGVVNGTTLNSFTVFIREFIQIILFMFLLVSISPLLTATAFSTSIVSIILIKFAVKILRKYAERMQNAMADYTSTMNESITGIRVVKAYNYEENASNKFMQDTYRYVRSAIKHKKVIELISPINEMFAIIALTVVLLIGGGQVLSGEMQPEKLMLFLFSLFSIMSPISTVFNSLSRFQHGIVAAERIFSIIDSEPKVKNGNESNLNFNNSITFSNLSFSYKNDLVLKNINLEIKKSKKIAFVGASGSGKSTMLDLIIRFYDPTNGEINIDGKNIKDYNIKAYRSLFGIVSQENILFNDTLANNIKYGLENVSDEELIEATKKANCYNFIMKLPEKFDTRIGDRGTTLSGGERQRVAIARALLREPEILIFDEATSALDAESEKIVQEAINKSLGNKTAILVAHRLSTIIDADEIIVFDKGEIVERGTHTALINMNGFYSKLYNLQHSVK
ncbi:MAG TPA: ABC transporter ATP-binding protein [Candidatus Kapabacteria bacterium]|nr:ABC transporter ATP-binding protein [Candidatus Kapabacteria bacterium]